MKNIKNYDEFVNESLYDKLKGFIGKVGKFLGGSDKDKDVLDVTKDIDDKSKSKELNTELVKTGEKILMVTKKDDDNGEAQYLQRVGSAEQYNIFTILHNAEVTKGVESVKDSGDIILISNKEKYVKGKPIKFLKIDGEAKKMTEITSKYPFDSTVYNKFLPKDLK